MMKLTLMTLAMAFMAFIPFANAMDQHAMADKAMTDKAPVTAVVFYAENCGSCKILDPRMKEAMNAINQDKVDVVKFDFSNSGTIEATKALAASKGLNATLQEYGAKTGFVVLLNKDGEMLAKLSKADETPDIAAKMANAIAQAS